jgi:DNA-binding MarR family transcriptional regulator
MLLFPQVTSLSSHSSEERNGQPLRIGSTTITSHGKELSNAIAALREVILAGERYRLAAATYLGLSINESQAVSYLLSRGPLGQHELADAMNMTTGSITSLVDRLEERGYAVRVQHPTDRRRLIVHLSDRGMQALNVTRSWMRDAFTEVPGEELAELTDRLRAIASGLRARAGAVPVSASGDTIRPRRRR